MSGESRQLKGLGPFNVWEVAVGLLALGIAGVAWALVTASIVGALNVVALFGGFLLLVAGLFVLQWDLHHRG